MRRILLASSAACCLISACVQFEDSTAAPDAAEPVDTAVPDTAVTDTDEADTDETEDDGSTDVPVVLGPVLGNNFGQAYAAPGVCGADMEFPIEFQGCPGVLDPPFWQQPVSALAGGMYSVQASCESSTADAASGLHITFPYEDASSNVAMVWLTSAANTWTEVQFGTTPDNLDQFARGISFQYDAIRLDGRRAHEARLCGLTPATTYFYRVGGGDTWSDVYTFTTAPARGSDEPFRIAVTGDSRNETQALLGPALDGILSQDADLLLFTGDAVNIGTDQREWDVFYEQGSATAESDRFASLPWIFVNGNHDLLGDPAWGLNAQPRNEQNFWHRYGNTVFISLDDTGGFITQELPGGGARDFLIEALEANTDARWRIVGHHKPMYSCGTRHGQDFGLLDEWAPIFDQYNVDFVFNGHEHNYERSAPLRANARAANGTVYVVAAGIGAPLYDIESDCFWTEKALKTPTYVILDITADSISATTYDLQGGVVDTFSRQASDR